ncbi:MAG: primosomal protein N' [Eubacteriales bacterium]|nr:primosomal protein N' [Eubacteriales bacterium]
MLYAKVFIDSSSVASDRIYEYRVPDELCEAIRPAMRVGVPFGAGNRHTQAFVVSLSEESEFDPERLKSISYIADTEPVVPDYLADTAVFLHDRYFAGYGEAVRVVVPSMDKLVRKVAYRLSDGAVSSEFVSAVSADDAPLAQGIFETLSDGRERSLSTIKNRPGLSSGRLIPVLSILKKKQLIQVREEYIPQNSDRYDEYISLAGGSGNPLEDYLMIVGKRAQKQREIVTFLYECASPVLKRELLKATGASSQSLESLIENNLVISEKKLRSYEEPVPGALKKPPELTSEQKSAMDIFSSQPDGSKFLVYGVTGSGKTDLYFEMFDTVLKTGKQCLLLVPEISLTPQMMRRVRERFGNTAAIMHSRLTQTEKIIEYQKIKRGEARIVLGARSALFMPFRELGIIVIDEMHETSYRSSGSPRYDAVETAEFIAARTGATLVLGSATPTTEIYYRTMRGEFTLITMKNRINGSVLPKVEIVDMRSELRHGNRSPISDLLREKIQQRLDAGEQVLLFLNRRGYNTYVFCRSCGHIEMCPNCSVSLTTHASSSTMQCHYCGYTKSIPQVCPECGSEKIRFMGTGTEKIQQSVSEMFPSARVLRLDADTASGKNMQQILEDFSKGSGDILVGTQMIVKGLDFDSLTLVGIILADSSLNFPDISAAARTFQLTTQAEGRAGRRDLPGEVVLQTYKPESPTLIYASLHDFEGFYSYDIDFRRENDYPPFSEIVGFFCACEDEARCEADCQLVHDRIEYLMKKFAGNEKVTLYRTAPAFIQKLKNKHIRHVIIKVEPGGGFLKVLRRYYDNIRKGLASYVYVEIGPVTLL